MSHSILPASGGEVQLQHLHTCAQPEPSRSSADDAQPVLLHADEPESSVSDELQAVRVHITPLDDDASESHNAAASSAQAIARQQLKTHSGHMRVHEHPSFSISASAASASAISASAGIAVSPLPLSPSSERLSLLTLPNDCSFLVLLLLDGASLAALSGCSRGLFGLTAGDEASFVWRGIARSDVVRLPLHERRGFSEPVTPADVSNLTAGDEDDDMVAAAVAAAMAEPARRAHVMMLSPRAQYLLRLKQRRMAQDGVKQELLRVRTAAMKIRRRDRAFVRSQLHLEAAFMLGTPLLLLASSILLLLADRIGSAASWAVFVPLWVAVVLLGCLTLSMHRLRRQHARRKRRERLNASASPPTIVTPTLLSAGATPSGSASRSVTGSVMVPQPGHAVAASVSSAAGSASPRASTSVRARSPAAQQQQRDRDRRNDRFLLSRQLVGGAAGDSVGAGGEGVLAWILSSHFDTPTHARVNATRFGLLVAALVLLCLKHTLPASAADRLLYAFVFLPLYALLLFGLVHPLLPARWFSPSFGSSLAEFSGGASAFAKVHLAQWAAWSACPFTFLALLAAHLDHAAPTVSLTHACIPVWVWLGSIALVLFSLALHFGLGLIVSRPVAELSPHAGAAASPRSPGHWSWSLRMDAQQRNVRLGCTMLSACAVLVALLVFSALLCERSTRMHSSPPASALRSELLCVPLVVAMLVLALLAAASTQQMYSQRTLEEKRPTGTQPALPAAGST